MAYATTNPPRLISQSVGATGGALWYYASEDAQSDVRVSGYFTNGYDLGIKAGDVLLAVDTDDYASAIMVCNASSATAVDFTDGTAIAATDTD